MKYVSLIIGFEVCVSQMMYRKIRTLPSMANLGYMKSFGLRLRVMIQKTLPRKFSKLKNVRSVPQTDTGDQVE